MPRFRLLIEYDGRAYAGWQRQANLPTVQGALEAAIQKFSGEAVTLRGAGRTDAGVHASGQVAHFDLSGGWTEKTARDATNAHLTQAGEAVSVLAAELVPESFDARFSALARHYRYTILNRRAPPALERGFVWWVPKPLDADAMAEAAKCLLGRHDFTTFRSVQCQANSPVRTLDRLDVVRQGDRIAFITSARSFLHNQVRSMVGSLRRVGEGGWTPGDLKSALQAQDRKRCAGLAPPEGLCLERVDYPPDGPLP